MSRPLQRYIALDEWLGRTLRVRVEFDIPSAVLREHPQLRFKELGFGSTHTYISPPPL